ncbi:DotU family type IV/VI secretion system protein [Alteromonas sp. a30]|uniref:DotU family type IV/VI secretion system protein n=1 Tax=Alteromonas sp. a30 TaxID=2730917 RepID=UPI00227E68F2|nr:DotU family type IV/VI secretion system protein [Alteromonas sp. a30]MCY7293849.1 hypothetical protein [Alteromonas sp. a30]
MTIAPKASNNDLLILHVFEESLAYWSELKKRIHMHNQSDNKLKHEDGTLVSDLPLYLHWELNNFFEQQKQNMERSNLGGQFADYLDMQYALVAFIDDQLLNENANLLTEPMRWIDYLLERSLFSTSVAGDKLIQKMQELTQQNVSMSLASKEARLKAYVYLCLLWQGFEGSLRRCLSDKTELARMKAKLIEICEYSALDISDKNHALINQAFGYAPSQRSKNKDLDNARLAPISRWHRVVLVAAALYLVASSALWFSLTNELNATFDKEFQQKQQQLMNNKVEPKNGKNKEATL